jgi:two-component system sensor histidine kinase AgrC
MIKDITKLLGILMDNAIDASKKSKEKEIFLYMTEEKKYINIKIMNSIKDDKGLKNIGKKRYSTKGKNHGFGLLLAKEIVRKNKKLELVTDIDENMFSQTILIDKK